MQIVFSDTAVTPHQQAVAKSIEEILARVVKHDRTVEPSEGNGPSVVFGIRTSMPRLSVQLILYQDSFHVLANGAEMRIDLVQPEWYQEWAEDVRRTTRALISGPLRLRVRHTLFRREPVGAICLASEEGDCWNGDGASIRGAGEESTFTDWYERVRVG